MSYITIRQLEVFVGAAKTLSFARVAEQLRLTPSAVSFQIRQIEQQIGFDLFERVGRKVMLTNAGWILLEYARPVLQTMEELNARMVALQHVSGGRVRLGLVSTAKYIVPHMIARFRDENAGVMIHLQEGNRRQVLSLLLTGEIDLAIMGRPPPEAELAAERFVDHPSVIVAAPNHPLCDARDIPLSALISEWFILREDGSGTRALSDVLFSTAGYSPRTAMETSSNEMIKQAVMAGMGLALISQHTIRLEESLGLIRSLDVRGFPLMRSWFVVQRRTAPLLPTQAGLRDFLIAHGQKIVDQFGANPRHGGDVVTPTSKVVAAEGVRTR